MLEQEIKIDFFKKLALQELKDNILPANDIVELLIEKGATKTEATHVFNMAYEEHRKELKTDREIGMGMMLFGIPLFLIGLGILVYLYKQNGHIATSRILLLPITLGIGITVYGYRRMTNF